MSLFTFSHTAQIFKKLKRFKNFKFCDWSIGVEGRVKREEKREEDNLYDNLFIAATNIRPPKIQNLTIFIFLLGRGAKNGKWKFQQRGEN